MLQSDFLPAVPLLPACPQVLNAVQILQRLRRPGVYSA